MSSQYGGELSHRTDSLHISDLRFSHAPPPKRPWTPHERQRPLTALRAAGAAQGAPRGVRWAISGLRRVRARPLRLQALARDAADDRGTRLGAAHGGGRRGACIPPATWPRGVLAQLRERGAALFRRRRRSAVPLGAVLCASWLLSLG